MKGFSTLEILIAMAILVITLASVSLVSFGDQSMLAQGGAQDQALQKAQKLLETEQQKASEDFRLLEATTSVDGMFEQSVVVRDWPPDPYVVKQITASVSWSGDGDQKQDVVLSKLVSDFADPTTLDTCDPYLTGNWENPQVTNYLLSPGQLLPTLAPSGHSFSPTDPTAALDAYKGVLYAAVGTTSISGNDSLFVLDLSDPARPLYRGGIDNNTASTKGLNAITVSGTYAYAANSFGANFKSCKQAANCAQLQIFDVSNASSIPAPTNFLLPTTSPAFITGSGGQASGASIFYKDGYVYLGLQKTLTGPEFNIINVSDPTHPQWVGGYQVGNTINQIYVRGKYAYLATDDKTREFIVLDISDPVHPSVAGSFDPKTPLGYETGQSMYLRGDDAYVGMAFASGSPEIYDLDISDPATIVSKGTYTFGSTVLGLFTRDSVLFALASTIGKFESLNGSIPGSFASYTPALKLVGTGGAVDCEGNYFYIGNNAAQGNITIVTGS